MKEINATIDHLEAQLPGIGKLIADVTGKEEKAMSEEVIITAEDLEKHKHIPDNELIQDIRETEADILRFIKLRDAHRIIGNETTDRMSHYRADGYNHRIQEAQELLAFLDALRRARQK